MANLGEVFGALHDVILERFKARHGGEAGNAFVAFEFGTPIPDDTFRMNESETGLSPELAVEFMSHHANTVPLVKNMLFTRRTYSVDEQYGLLLAGAMPTSETGMELLGQVRRNAGMEFDQTLGSMAGPERFHPVYATPVNWYDTTEESNWQRIEISQADRPTSARPRPAVDPNLKQWRVAPDAVKPLLQSRVTSEALRQLEVQAAPRPDGARPKQNFKKALRRAAIQDVSGALLRAIPAASVRGFAAVADRPVASEAVVQAAPGAFVARQFRADDALVVSDVLQPAQEPPAVKLGSALGSNATLQFATAVSTDAKPQEVASDQFSIDVSMCFVELRRPWLSDGLLSLRNWYVPSFEKGSFSSGKGATDAGHFALLPTACILIRDLKIKAQWSDDDRDAIEGSANLGGFNLFGRSFDSNTAVLQVPGMQSIAWVCEPMPVLPPAGAPTR